MARYRLTLYITGDTPRAQAAVANLRRLCDEQLKDEYEVDVVDVLERPDLAEEHKILATPTLIKHLPPPLRRIIGDLSDVEQVLTGLDLTQLHNGHEEAP
jgi:circadian clock protein KaiB